MAERNQGHIRVVLTKNKQYRISLVAENGEVLSVSETLSSQENVDKNIKAQLNAFGGESINVRIFAGSLRRGAAFKLYNYSSDGNIKEEGSGFHEGKKEKGQD